MTDSRSMLKMFGVALVALGICLGTGRLADAACNPNGKAGAVDPGEACDDGNVNDGDSCRNDCTLNECGDKVLRTVGNCILDEQCVQGNNNGKPCETDADCAPLSGGTCQEAGGVNTQNASSINCLTDGECPQNTDGCDTESFPSVLSAGAGVPAETCDPPYDAAKPIKADIGCGDTCQDFCALGAAAVNTNLGEECDAACINTTGGKDDGDHCNTDADCPGGTCTVLFATAFDNCSDTFSCLGGANNNTACDPNADCPGGTCGGVTCAGGTNAGDPCDPDSDCPQGTCNGNTAQPVSFNTFRGQCVSVGGVGAVVIGAGCSDAGDCQNVGSNQTGTCKINGKCEPTCQVTFNCANCGDGKIEKLEGCERPFRTDGGTNAGRCGGADTGKLCDSNDDCDDNPPCFAGEADCDGACQGGPNGCGDTCNDDCGDGDTNDALGEQCDRSCVGGKDNGLPCNVTTDCAVGGACTGGFGTSFDDCTDNAYRTCIGGPNNKLSCKVDTDCPGAGVGGCAAQEDSDCPGGTCATLAPYVCSGGPNAGDPCGNFPKCTAECKVTISCSQCGDGNLEKAEECERPFAEGRCGGADTGTVCSTDNDCDNDPPCLPNEADCDELCVPGANGCSADCNDTCGDGVVQGGNGEECDAICTGGFNAACPGGTCSTVTGLCVGGSKAGAGCTPIQCKEAEDCAGRCSNDPSKTIPCEGGVDSNDCPITQPDGRGDCINPAPGVCGPDAGSCAGVPNPKGPSFDSGDVTCQQCKLDTSECGICGNKVIENDDEECDPPWTNTCDGGDQGGLDCNDECDCLPDDAFGQGGTCGENRGCNATCEITNCGDAFLDTKAGEECDAGDSRCSSLGNSDGGKCDKACVADLGECVRDDSDCPGGTCTGGKCVGGKDDGDACDGIAGATDGDPCCCGPGCPAGTTPCNSDITPNCCTQDCRFAHCGDGKADSGEVCDDGVGAKRDAIDETDNCPNGTNTFGSSCDGRVCAGGVNMGDDCDADADCPASECIILANVACGIVPTCGDGLPKLFNSSNCDPNETLLDGSNLNGECSDACDNPGDPKDPKNKPKETEECDNGDETDPNVLLCLLVTPGSSADCSGFGGTPAGDDDCLVDSFNRCNKGGIIPGAGDNQCITDNNCKGEDNSCGNSDTTSGACRDSCELPQCGDDVTDVQSEGCDGGDAACEGNFSAQRVCVGGPTPGAECNTEEVAGGACPAAPAGCDCGGRCEGGDRHQALCNDDTDCPGTPAGDCRAQASCITPCESDDDCDNNPPCLPNEADCDDACRDASSTTGEADGNDACEEDPLAGQFCVGGFADDGNDETAPIVTCQGPTDSDCLCPITGNVFLPGVCRPGDSINPNECCTTDKDCGTVCDGGTRDGLVCFNNSDCPDPDQNKATCIQGVCDIGSCVDGSKLPDSGANHCVGDPNQDCNDDTDCDLNDVCESVCNNSLPDGCHDCALPGCGDGTLDAGEECDQGSGNGADQPCTNTCFNAECGDGKACTDAACTSGPSGDPEQCDDGNATDVDSCKGDCSLNVCGDGSQKQSPPEELCDDGNTADGDGCSSGCCPEVAGVVGDIPAKFEALDCNSAALTPLIDEIADQPRCARSAESRLSKLLARMEERTARAEADFNAGSFRRSCHFLGGTRSGSIAIGRVATRMITRGCVDPALGARMTMVASTIEAIASDARNEVCF